MVRLLPLFFSLWIADTLINHNFPQNQRTHSYHNYIFSFKICCTFHRNHYRNDHSSLPNSRPVENQQGTSSICGHDLCPYNNNPDSDRTPKSRCCKGNRRKVRHTHHLCRCHPLLRPDMLEGIDPGCSSNSQACSNNNNLYQTRRQHVVNTQSTHQQVSFEMKACHNKLLRIKLRR